MIFELLKIVFGLVGQGGEGAFQRQATGDQAGELAGPDGQGRGAKNPSTPQGGVPAGLRARTLAVIGGLSDRLHPQWHQ